MLGDTNSSVRPLERTYPLLLSISYRHSPIRHTAFVERRLHRIDVAIEGGGGRRTWWQGELLVVRVAINRMLRCCDWVGEYGEFEECGGEEHYHEECEGDFEGFAEGDVVVEVGHWD